MTASEDAHLPLRQWRVTVTEDLADGARHAHLSWRTFPCAATKWDGSMWCTIQPTGLLAITSQEALREVLGALAAQPWHEGRYPKRPRP